MKVLPDYHNYASLSGYIEAIKGAGLDFPAILGWVIQSAMAGYGYTFVAAMDELIRGGAIVLLETSEPMEGKLDTKLSDVSQRMEELDACKQKDSEPE